VKRPELLEPVVATSGVLTKHDILKVSVHGSPECSLEAIGIEPKEALEPVGVAVARICLGQMEKVQIRWHVEVVAQADRPQPKQRVHRLGLTGPYTQLVPFHIQSESTVVNAIIRQRDVT
jgi:hypothetical protein